MDAEPRQRAMAKTRPLRPCDFTILGLTFEGHNDKHISSAVGRSISYIQALRKSAAYQAQQEAIQATMVRRIADGEFGTLALAKQEQMRSMQKIGHLRDFAKNERLQFDAAVYLLGIAGIQQAKPPVVESVDRLIDDMTAEEIDTFLASGTFPERMRNQLARVSAAALSDRDPVNRPPRIETETTHRE